MRELGCDIVMIGRAPANQIVIDQTLDGFGRSCSAPSDATSTRAREILLNASRLFSTVCDILPTVQIANIIMPTEAERAERRAIHERLDAIARRLAEA